MHMQVLANLQLMLSTPCDSWYRGLRSGTPLRAFRKPHCSSGHNRRGLPLRIL